MHQLPEALFPLGAVRTHCIFMLVVSYQMRYLVHQGYKKSVFVEVVIDGNGMVESLPWRGVIAQAGAALAFYFELKIKLHDPLGNLWHAGRRNVFCQNF